jgi:hypothetical protein
MRKSIFLICSLVLLISCNEEFPKARLLEFKINGQIYSFEGYSYRNNDYKNNTLVGYDWHFYNFGNKAMNIHAYDSSLIKVAYTCPEFEAIYTIKSSATDSVTYKAVSGQFRNTGFEMGEIMGDFHFKMKNILNPLDSLMITEGYFRIYLDQFNRVISR